jgi:putative addiction module component (TIGR02574 family)
VSRNPPRLFPKNVEKVMSPQIASVFDLTLAEKLQLVEDLWDDIASTPEAIPVHEWQKEELARRKANLQKNPASGLNWEEVKRRVRSRHGR